MVDVEHVRRWLQERGIGDACPMCKGNDLRIGRQLYQLVPTPAPLRLATLDQHSGAVRVRCGTCAYLMLFHARSMGIDVGEDVRRRRRAAQRARPAK